MTKEKNRNWLRFCRKDVIPAIRDTAVALIGESYCIDKKSHGNYITSIDMAIEKKLKQCLSALLPGSVFLAEESEPDQELESEYRWIIDPIDGTTNFIYGLPYTVSVALEHLPTKQTLLGVVLVPKENTVYYAARNQGSYRETAGNTVQIHTGSFEEKEGLAIFGMPYDRSKTDRIFDIAKCYYPSCSDLKRIGPSSLDICMVASGIAKVYFELDLHEWDVAAGLLILQEAGGLCEKQDDLMIFRCGE